MITQEWIHNDLFLPVVPDLREWCLDYAKQLVLEVNECGGDIPEYAEYLEQLTGVFDLMCHMGLGIYDYGVDDDNMICIEEFTDDRRLKGRLE